MNKTYMIETRNSLTNRWLWWGCTCDSVEEARERAAEWIRTNVDDEAYANELLATAATLDVGDEMCVNECEGIDRDYQLRLVEEV